jgi:hypothetical protein
MMIIIAPNCSKQLREMSIRTPNRHKHTADLFIPPSQQSKALPYDSIFQEPTNLPPRRPENHKTILQITPSTGTPFPIRVTSAQGNSHHLMDN